MLTLSLVLNAVIVFPVSIALFQDRPGMEAAFGAQSDARSILASVYLAIGLVSAAAIAGLAAGWGEIIRPMAIGLLTMQIVYKIITVWSVGLASPVVQTNLLVVLVHTLTVVMLVRNAV